MQIQFDIKRSLKTNPPAYPPGVNFIRRKVINLQKLITTDSKGVPLQPREKLINSHKRQKLIDSYKMFGVLYEKPVMVVCKDISTNLDELVGGNNRHNALTTGLGITNYFADEVSFDTPYHYINFKSVSNCTKDHLAPATPMNKNDYQKILRTHKNNKTFNWRDDDLVRQTLRDASDNTLSDSKIENYLNKFREVVGNTQIGVKPLNVPMANAELTKLGLPSKGYVDRPTRGKAKPYANRIGYTVETGNIPNKILGWMHESDKHNGITVEIYGFIQQIRHDHIKEDREAWLNNFNFWLNSSYISEECRKRIVFKGFISQITTPDPTNGGAPMETGIVDVNGRKI